MADVPVVAVAVVNGECQDTAIGGHVVQAVAVGKPVPQVARGPSINDDDTAPSSAGASASDTPVAQGFVYSPFMAKIFSDIDADSMIRPATELNFLEGGESAFLLRSHIIDVSYCRVWHD